MNRLAGRFSLIDRPNKDTVIVGCLGSLKAKTLTDDEKQYIAAFYIGGFPSNVEVKESEVLVDYDCENKDNYNSFIKLITENRQK